MTEKLKIGLLDLLTILLPGGFLLAILSQFETIRKNFEQLFPISKQNDWLPIVLSIASAYVLGHFIYFIASFLDGWIFENVRKVYWNDFRLTAYVVKLKADITGINDRKIINAFKWSCAWLLMNVPAMYAEVEKYIAESKFFRSIAIVSLLTFFFTIFSKPGFGMVMLLLTILSLIRYLTQRQKSIETAYIFIITASAQQFDLKPDPTTVTELGKRSITINPVDEPTAYDFRRTQKGLISLQTQLRKLGTVLNLCLNPFYMYEINPSGSPQYVTKEARWFFKDDNTELRNAVTDLLPVNKQPEKRTDVYYLNRNNPALNIKQRSANGSFEIKQQSGCSDQWILSGITVNPECWSKWVLTENEGNSLQKSLATKKYQRLNVDKERYAFVVSINKEGNVLIHNIDADIDSGCQVEYTLLTIDGKSYYSFAIEVFGDPMPPAEMLNRFFVFSSSEFKNSQFVSYSKFLHQLGYKQKS